MFQNSRKVSQAIVSAVDAGARVLNISLGGYDTTDTLNRAIDYASALQEYEMRRAEFTGALQPLREHAANISRIAAAAYREGGTDLLRLLDAERARLDAEMALARGVVDYRQSIVKLEAAEGVNP